jgi:Protein of unknown function (DUF2911)
MHLRRLPSERTIERMRKTLMVVLGCLVFGGLAWKTAAQQRKSPHEQASTTIAGKKITIDYGRPYARGRKIIGGLVPYGQVWRTGADEATVLTTDTDLDINGLKVPKGSYSLFTLPSDSGWKLIVNKTAKQWGAFKYQESDDLGRVDMNVSKSPQPVEQFTISFEPAGSNKVVLKMAWENTVASVPITAAS